MAFKIATFNVENLFSRPALMNFQNNSTGAERLQKVARLQQLLAKSDYAEDKAEIERLYGELAPYIEINKQRGATVFRGRQDTGYTLVPSGSREWYGFIELKRESFSRLQVETTAKVIRDVDADVLAVIEVEDRIALDRFNREAVRRRGLNYAVSVEGNDPRGIDVGLLSKHPIGGMRTNCFDKKGSSRIFSRDCLEIEVRPDGQPPVHFLINHFKSKSGGDSPASQLRRKNQSERVAAILEERYDLTQDRVVVLGDLNDTPGSGPLKPLLDVAHLTDVLSSLPEEDRWTYKYRSDLNQIDFVLVSKPLAERQSAAGVFRRGMVAGGAGRYPEVTSWDKAASDHGAVWAEFDL